VARFFFPVLGCGVFLSCPRPPKFFKIPFTHTNKGFSLHFIFLGPTTAYLKKTAFFSNHKKNRFYPHRLNFWAFPSLVLRTLGGFFVKFRTYFSWWLCPGTLLKTPPPWENPTKNTRTPKGVLNRFLSASATPFNPPPSPGSSFVPPQQLFLGLKKGDATFLLAFGKRPVLSVDCADYTQVGVNRPSLDNPKDSFFIHFLGRYYFLQKIWLSTKVSPKPPLAGTVATWGWGGGGSRGALPPFFNPPQSAVLLFLTENTSFAPGGGTAKKGPIFFSPRPRVFESTFFVMLQFFCCPFYGVRGPVSRLTAGVKEFCPPRHFRWVQRLYLPSPPITPHHSQTRANGLTLSFIIFSNPFSMYRLVGGRFGLGGPPLKTPWEFKVIFGWGFGREPWFFFKP